MGACACSFDRRGIAGELPAAGTVAGSIGKHKENSGQNQPRPWGWPRADRGQCCAPATTVASATGRPWPVLLHQPRPGRGWSHDRGSFCAVRFSAAMCIISISCTLLSIPKHPCSVISVPCSFNHGDAHVRSMKYFRVYNTPG